MTTLQVLYLLLLLASVACFVIAAVVTASRVNLVAIGLALVAAGLALYVLVPTIQLINRLG